ncbi:hypothetical protein C8N46_101274 [Kordia periserrulae]|uniref:Uncharacterized protein n=1 Tax=Kordia periserrulae TaxID=701523 RepID=A0A2T6C5V1_9FLAO|nr:hypothetical protein [Kordia periserrulae]PTX63672.1 hypothetical protein C8N46_101274 [Kordia periserrulae]
MKKKSIHKLHLKKAAVSNLNMAVVKGGNDANSDFPCVSVNFSCFSFNFCETIDYTACNGEYICQIYQEPQR